MDSEMHALLLRDFPAREIGHKPASACKACSAAIRNRVAKSCGDHEVAWCKTCKVKTTKTHFCLSFVGHAYVRHRLCQADPDWTWEPYDFPGTGPLVMSGDKPVGLWINLTIGGVTKPGYGSSDTGGKDAIKELISNAIRNAAQSFGVGWRLWAKEEKDAGTEPEAESFENASPAPPRGSANGRGRQRSAAPASQQAGAPAPDATGEPDAEAQAFANEASQCHTVAALADVHGRARAAEKLAKEIRNPATDGNGRLGQYIDWRRRILAEEEAAFADLQAAAQSAGLEGDGELDEQVQRVAGTGVEGATAAQLRETARQLRSGALAGAPA